MAAMSRSTKSKIGVGIFLLLSLALTLSAVYVIVITVKPPLNEDEGAVDPGDADESGSVDQSNSASYINLDAGVKAPEPVLLTKVGFKPALAKGSPSL